MGHLAGKDIYRELGRKLDQHMIRVPWNETLHAILKELYTEEEADVVVKMPYGLSSFSRIARITGCDRTRLRKILDGLCSKGLVIDVWVNNKYRYIVSPMVIGIFEFTMMRTGGNLNTKEWAKLFYDYMQGDGAFFAANCREGDRISLLRTLPHEEAIADEEHVEVLDYEKARAIVEDADRFSIGICSCRHEKLHLGKKECDAPLAVCTSFGPSADFLIRNNLAEEVSRSEVLETLARSREMGLVFNADNVKKNIGFICQCCKCCCNVFAGMTKFGYANAVVTSGYIAEWDESLCDGCGKCAKACPVNAIEMVRIKDPKTKKKKNPKLDASVCLGCGVCVLKCDTGALKLKKRKSRVILPETTFERVILQCLERGTLQYQIFDNPQSTIQKTMRAFLGAFLNLPPVKRALMSDMLRSRFLASMKMGISL